MPSSAIFTAASADVAMAPEARPGDAPSPVAMTGASTERSAVVWGGSARRAATRSTASAASEREVVVLGHLHGDPAGRLGGALPDAGLEHPEPPVLDGELDVADVTEVPLEAIGV